jgi:cyanophycin synthetase
MITREELAGLHTNQRLVLQELLGRGVEIELLVKELELVEARLGDHVEFLLDRDASIFPYSSCLIAANKYLTKRLLLRAGLSVPCGEQFCGDQREDAMRYGASLHFPLVVKPTHGSHGELCFTDLDNLAQLEEAFDASIAALGERQPVLIEEQRPGMEFRVFITRHGDFAVLHRDPASVVGDGRHTIRELAESETERRMNPRTTSLCPIVLDRHAESFLSRFGLSLNSVPAAGTKVYLRRNSNVAQGGMCEDYSDRAHPSVVDVALRALRVIHSLPCAGVDILSIDITAPQTPDRYVILEINSNPGVAMHMRPGRGKAQNVAKYVADLIFPETRSTGA